MKEAIGYIMVNPNMADQVASSEPTVGIALTQFTPPNPLHMETV